MTDLIFRDMASNIKSNGIYDGFEAETKKSQASFKII